MELSTQIVPAVIILVANLLSGRHGSLRWETVTAVFGWAAVISFVLFLIIKMVSCDSLANGYLLQIFGFCLLTALTRDYERILRSIFPWNR